MRIAIAGAGWYGCHLGAFLQQIGFDVSIFERNEAVFTGASGKNQNRLHLGFHYARDYTTRFQSRDGFSRFIERYSGLSETVKNNLYAVPQGDSLIDFRTYKSIMASSGIEFEEFDMSCPEAEGLTRLAGLINTDERVVSTAKAARFFGRHLEPVLRFNTPLTPSQILQLDDCVEVAGERFDYLIDATWGKLTKPDIDVYYEPTLLLYYRTTRPDWALTMVDGPLCSIYPTDESGIVTLSSVPHTPLGKYKNVAEAEAMLNSVDADLVAKKQTLFEEQIRSYYPDYLDAFCYEAPQLSMKTKPIGAEDNRACYVFRDRRIFSVMSGKIDTIFVAAERVISAIGQTAF